MSNYNSRDLHRRLDLCGALERVQEREQARKAAQDAQQEVNEAAEAYRAALERVRKQEKQAPQQVDAVSVEARERGFGGHLPGMRREINMKLVLADPILFFFHVENSRPDLT